MWRKQPGSVGNVMVTGMCMLAMTVLMLGYMDMVGLMAQRAEVSQLARKYILRMETVGYLSNGDRNALNGELQALGVTDLDCAGTTDSEVGYGDAIYLQIQGRLKGKYGFVEKKVSTGKN